jgi:heme/copper-type cytochrome/quinol oxidase subunit 2
MYLAMRRRKATDRWRTAWGIAGKILAVIVGAVMAVEATTYVTHWSDGSRTEDSDAAGLAFLQLGFLAVVAVLLLFFAIYVVPVFTVCNFILNYTPGLGERMLPKRPLPAF